MKKILVIGASGDIGIEVTKNLLNLGHNVVGTYNSTIRDFTHSNLKWISMDLTSDQSIEKSLPTDTEFNVIIFAAGVYTIGPLLSHSVSELAKVHRINVLSLIKILQLLLPTMISAKSRLIVISSDSSIFPFEDEGLYCASKASLHMSTEILRLELSKYGISVIDVILGIVATRIIERPYRELSSSKRENVRVFGDHLEGLMNSEHKVQKIVSAGKEKKRVAEALAQLALIGNPRNVYSILSKDEKENLDTYLLMKLDQITKNEVILGD